MTNWKRVYKIPAVTTSCFTAVMYSSIISMFSVLNAAIAQCHPFLRLWSTIMQWHLLGIIWLTDKLYQHKLFWRSPTGYSSCCWLSSYCIYTHWIGNADKSSFYRPRTLFMTLSQRSLNHDFWLCVVFIATCQCYTLHFWRFEVILVTLKELYYQEMRIIHHKIIGHFYKNKDCS